MAFINANGVEIAYSAYGEKGNPLLLMVHGALGNKEDFNPLAERYANTHYVIAYDCRGHGESEKPRRYTLEDHARDLLAIIDATGYRQADVYGYSMGSYIVLKAAALGQGKIRRCVAIATRSWGRTSSIRRMLTDWRTYAQFSPSMGFGIGGLATLWSPDTSKALRRLATAAERQKAKKQSHRWHIVREALAADRALRNFDLRDCCKEIACPVLIIQGRHDQINPPEAAEELIQGIANCRSIVMEHSGHMIGVEEPNKLFSAVIDFLTAP